MMVLFALAVVMSVCVLIDLGLLSQAVVIGVVGLLLFPLVKAFMEALRD